MSKEIQRRCYCRDAVGKELGAACPKHKSNSRHGVWSYRVSAGFDPGTGKRRYVRKSGLASHEAAESEVLDIKRKLNQGQFRFTPLTVESHLRAWFARAVKNGDIKASTASDYRRYLDGDIIPALGHHKLTALRKHHVADWIEQLQDDGRGLTAIHRAHATLRSGLSEALERDLIDFNPAVRVRLPKLTKTRVQPWEPEEAGTFLDVASEHRIGALFELAVLTGLRRGELVGLRWTDADLSSRRRRLTVNVQIVRVDGSALEQSVKTEAGQHREVALDDRAVGALLAWRIRQDQERATAESIGAPWTSTGRIFTMEDGRDLRPEYPSAVFEILNQRSGLRDQRFHDLRHLFASLMLSNGEDMGVVSKLMGHSNSQITRDLYAHLVGDRAHKAVAGAASLLPPLRRFDGGVLASVHATTKKAPLGTSKEVQAGLISQ